MPGVQGSMPLKHDPTVDLITAKPNKQKSISAGKVKERGGGEEIRSKRLEVVVVVVVVGGGCSCGRRRGVGLQEVYICHKCFLTAKTSRHVASADF